MSLRTYCWLWTDVTYEQYCILLKIGNRSNIMSDMSSYICQIVERPDHHCADDLVNSDLGCSIWKYSKGQLTPKVYFLALRVYQF